MATLNAASRISPGTAQQLIGTYMTEEGWQTGKTRAVWFSIADITDILSLINESGGDGARIYFAKYPSDTDIPGTPDPAYKGMVTTVFIPTLANPDGGHQDLFPPIATQDTETPAAGQAFNHGELCPPNCPPTLPTT